MYFFSTFRGEHEKAGKVQLSTRYRQCLNVFKVKFDHFDVFGVIGRIWKVTYYIYIGFVQRC